MTADPIVCQGRSANGIRATDITINKEEKIMGDALSFFGAFIGLSIMAVLVILPMRIGWRIMMAVERMAKTLESNPKSH